MKAEMEYEVNQRLKRRNHESKVDTIYSMTQSKNEWEKDCPPALGAQARRPHA